MKIRIKGNSVRFRLTQTEVKKLSEQGYVKETTNFGETVFTYRVKTEKGLDNLLADCKDNSITLKIPEKLGQEWYSNDRVGFENFLELNNVTKLHLLLEKDFTCLDNTIEDQSDNYPNPLAAQFKKKE